MGTQKSQGYRELGDIICHKYMLQLSSTFRKNIILSEEKLIYIQSLSAIMCWDIGKYKIKTARSKTSLQ
jgi:hypothetical protein